MNHILIDGTYVSAHKHSAAARHASGINQTLGRSRGGVTSEIHAVVDAPANLIAFKERHLIENFSVRSKIY